MAIQTLVMGFGGTGAHILTYLKELAVYKYGGTPPGLQFRLFDTIADWQPGKTVSLVGGAGEEIIASGHESSTSLDPSAEYFHLQDRTPDLRTYVFELMAQAGNPDRHPHLKDWLNTAWLSKYIPANSLNIVQGAAQQRQIGRFAMFQNVQFIVSQIQRTLQDFQRVAAGEDVNVWIVGSSAGGTGAGCLIDAAFMTHLAAHNARMTPRILGLVVLPEVFEDKDGISAARAFSLFRELERLQEQDINPERDRYVVSGSTASSEVMYDARGGTHAVIPGRLFDFLVYAGRRCVNDGQRVAFFSSVANAIDAYVDEQLGSRMMEALVNKPGRPLSFGSARLYMPLTTYAELFAWEQVREYLRGVGAPREERGQVVGVYAGAAADRQTSAQSKVEQLLPLFGEMLKLDGQSVSQQANFVRERLDASTIVTRWYQFGAIQIAGIDVTRAELESMVPLAYVNPYISLQQADDIAVQAQERRVKTYQENREAKGVKETQEESRDRFATDLMDVTGTYTDLRGGQGTFEGGRRLISRVMTLTLQRTVDTLIAHEFERYPRVSPESNQDADGTGLTRLYEELKWLDNADGPLGKIDRILGVFLSTLDSEEATRRHQAVEATQGLRECRPGMLNRFSTWVEGQQHQARDECTDYIRWYQKRELLRDMQKLVRDVQGRFRTWLVLFEDVLKLLVLQRQESRPAYYAVQMDHLKVLENRLERMANDESVLISLESHQTRDTTMQGYQDVLRQKAVRLDAGTLSQHALQQSRWQATVKDGGPVLTLTIPAAGEVAHERFKALPELLFQSFMGSIQTQLHDENIFDYLQYAQQVHRVNLRDVATRMYNTAGVLIDTSEQGTCAWVYQRPRDPLKGNVASALQKELTDISRGDQVVDAFENHSDRFSLSLLKVCQPNPDDIADIERCKSDYLRMLVADISGDGRRDEGVVRAQVYHPFRAELEAWYIERRYAKQVIGRNLDAQEMIPSRIVRLLDHPEMMRAFVHCIATKAVQKDSNDTWVWYDSENNERLVPLTDAHREGDADLLRAAVIFVLQQREARQGGRIPITASGAMKSAVAAAQRVGCNKDDLVLQFIHKELDDYLNTYFPPEAGVRDNRYLTTKYEQEKGALKMICQFYGERTARTDLTSRLTLP